MTNSRKLIYSINLTLDGCCDHTKGAAGEDVHDFFTHLLRNSDTLLYGRKTFDLMVPFWPDIARNGSGQTKAMNDFAHAFADVEDIVVFSRSLTHADYRKARIVNGDLRDEVMRLKHMPGGNILAGGVELPGQLIELGVVDEYQFVIQPLLVGEGRRLLEGMHLRENLNLIESIPLKSGAVVLRYLK